MKYLIPWGADTLIFDVAGNADVVAALHTAGQYDPVPGGGKRTGTGALAN